MSKVGLESNGQSAPLIPLDVALRLGEIAQLKDGWLDGEGFAPAKDKLDWLAAEFEAGISSGLPQPYLYPTTEGGIQAEWSLGDWSVSLEINLDTKVGEYHALSLKDQTCVEQKLQLGESAGWEQLSQALKQLYGPNIGEK